MVERDIGGGTAMAKKPTTTTRIYKDFSKRLRLVTAVTGVTSADLLDRVVGPVLAEEERKLAARLKSSQTPTRTKPVE
jgi:hypothetical protein